MKKTIIAFSIQMFNGPDGPAFSASKLGYAIEMTFDPDWPIEFIALTPPFFLRQFAENELKGYNVAVGISYVPSNRDFDALLNQGATWVLVFPNDDLPDRLPDKFGVILYLPDIDDFQSWKKPNEISAERVLLAIQSSSIAEPIATQTRIAALRDAWIKRFSEPIPRVLLCTGMTFVSAADMKQFSVEISNIPEADGMLLLDINPVVVSDLCRALVPLEKP